MNEQDLIERIKKLEGQVGYLERLQNAMAQNHGWIGDAWQKDPIRIGISDRILRTWTNLSLTAGNSDVDDTAVPAGEYWYITAYTFLYVGTSPTSVAFQVYDGSTVYHFGHVLAPANSVSYSSSGVPLLLKPGDRLRLRVVGATLNDDLHGFANGIRVDIDQ